MKFFLLLFVAFFSLFCVPSYSNDKYPTATKSQIFSTNDLGYIEELLESADKDTLVLWDVDQTLITPDDPILKPKYEEHLDQLLGGSKVMVDAFGKKRYIFREILIEAPHSLIDSRSVAIIQSLQKKHVPVVAFSAAPGGKVGKVDSFIDWRIKELKDFGLDFSSFFPEVQAFKLPKNPEAGFAPIYKSGVLISSTHRKGPVLTNFLKELGWAPKKIIFIDDKMANVQSVAHFLEDKAQVVGIHYMGANDLPCDLDEKAAKHQVDYFFKTGEWISQEKASLN